MSKIRKRGDKWVSRVRKNKKEKYVPLYTSSRVEAEMRNELVNKYEIEILNGMEIIFPWVGHNSAVKVKQFTISEACISWMQKRKEIRKNTRLINQKGVGYFIDFLGNNKPIDDVVNSTIIEFVDYLKSKGLSVSSINIHLRTIKAMFRYWYKMEKVNKVPLIEQIKTKKKDPIYISEQEFQNIMNLEWLDDFYKKVFLFYRDTGVRLREPLLSSLEGRWLDIPDEAKSGVARNVELNETLQFIFIEYESWFTEGYGSTIKDAGEHISKMFKKALNSIGASKDKHFHSLRHTYAVRSLLKGMSIYNLKLVLGHSSVTTTEVYSNMNLKRVSQDFPRLLSQGQTKNISGRWDMNLWDIDKDELSYVA